jgi:AraC-like DNA-binding protein
LVFNPDEPHAGHMRHSRYWRYRAFYLGRAALDGVLASLGRASLPGFTSNAVSDGGLIDRFVRAHRAFECGDSECGRELLIEGCADLFARAATGGRRDDLHYSAPVVDNALATIRGRFRERITLDELAGAQHLSPYQLIRAFRRVTGMPPHAHVTRARLHEAIRLIKRGVPLAEAATGAGFYDQSALTRHFRRAYGITPGQFITAQFSPIR